MKTIILSMILSQIFLLAQSEIQYKKINIDKNDKGGFNVYNSDGELLYEYSILNTDSAKLEILNDLFLEATIDRDKSEFTLIDVSKKGFDWGIVLVALLGLIGTFSAGYFTNKWNSKSQQEQYKRIVFVENRKEWVKNLQNNVAEFIGIMYEFDLVRMVYFQSFLKDTEGSIKFSLAQDFLKDGTRIDNNVAKLITKISSLIDRNNSKQKGLFDLIDGLRQKILKEDDIEKMKTPSALTEDTKAIRDLLNDIIQEEQAKLNELKFS